MKKSDWRKRVIGWLIRRQTAFSPKWISDHLKKGGRKPGQPSAWGHQRS
jgi:hypothetical protein